MMKNDTNQQDAEECRTCKNRRSAVRILLALSVAAAAAEIVASKDGRGREGEKAAAKKIGREG